MDSIMPKCTASLVDQFDYVTDTELSKIVSDMNKPTCSLDTFLLDY